MPLIDYAALRSRIPMARVLELLDFTPTRHRGPQLRGPCPLPGCSNRFANCFSVHLQRNIYHCFCCGHSGNQLDLWAAVKELSLYPAALDLCRHLNLAPPTRAPHQHPSPLKRLPSTRPATD